MSEIEESQRTERRCLLWVHDDQFSKEDVVLNVDLFPAGSLKPGVLMAITALKADTTVKEYPVREPTGRKGAQTLSVSHDPVENGEDQKSSTGSFGGESQQDMDSETQYLFAANDMGKEMRLKHPNLEVSIAKRVADVFGFKHRSNVLLTTVDKELSTASHVEISFRDEYLARSDMWRLAISEMANKTVYKTQKILFVASIRAQVTAVFVDGKRVQSAFFSTTTKPIFRSESARFVLFIQMSREMWDFDSEGSGEIMFTKVVNGFLPALFKRWMKLNVRHLVSIVLFTRVEYDKGIASEVADGGFDPNYHTGIQSSGSQKPYKDFYRVVVSEMASMEWTAILYSLKREFRYFRHDISMHRLNKLNVDYSGGLVDSGMGSVPGTRVEAEPALAIHGNILEAINLASNQYAHDYIDRDLLRTGISIVVITPGAGLFEVDYGMLQITTKNLVSSGIGIDLVCLPKIPLHSVPLFRYRTPKNVSLRDDMLDEETGSLSATPRQGLNFGSYSSFRESISPSKSSMNIRHNRNPIPIAEQDSDGWQFAIPHWLDVSFWTGAPQDLRSGPWSKVKTQNGTHHHDVVQNSVDFAVRCKMYELEMASIANEGMVEISVAPLSGDLSHAASLDNSAKESPTNPVVVQRTKKHSSLTETVLGPSRLAVHSRSLQAHKALFEVLDGYDYRASIPVTGSESAQSKMEGRKRTKSRHRLDGKKNLKDDTTVLGTSFKEETITPKATKSSGPKASSGNSAMDGDSQSIRNRNLDAAKPAATVLSPLRPAKISRNISLGIRGFGIAAPKAVAAELQVENAKASVAVASSNKAYGGTTSSSSSVTNHLLSSPRQEASLKRPTSSQYLPSDMGQTPADVIEKAPTRPIYIRSMGTPGEIQNQSKAKTALDSVHDGGNITWSDAKLGTLRKIESTDSFGETRRKGVLEAPSALLANVTAESAMSPWLTILNPSNPVPRGNVASQYKRWQHVFPKPLKTKAMKWKSLCSPASVPLTTEYFPTKEQLSFEYHQKPYTVSQDPDEDLDEVPKSKDEFLRELVSARLAQGFQIVVGPAVAEAFGQKILKIGDPFDHELLTEDGGSVFMSMGNNIHQLSCVNGMEVEVNTFVRKAISMSDSGDGFHRVYKPAVRTTLAPDYETRQIVLSIPNDDSNWNYVDSFIAGHTEEMTENLRFWRARFVLIPIQPPNAHHKRQGEDNEEETRIEGLRALTQLWQRHRFIPPSERHFNNIPSQKKKDPNPLDIVYQTQDPSVVVNAELETLSLADTSEHQARRGHLLSGAEPFRKEKFNIAALAEAIQAPVEKGGVRMQNRRWHFRLHYNCFIGSDMTTWFLENFEDIETRQEAEEFGNMLMVKDEERRQREKEPSDRPDGGKERDKEMGLFVHVERRHPFRDGQYFYQMHGEYAKPRPETKAGWPFGSLRRDASVPSTPLSEIGTSHSPRPNRTLASSGTYDKSADSGSTTPTNIGTRRPKVTLSRVMKYDVDPRRRSYRPERINLHYDRLHNPDNCYHVRIDWMNVTAKLIEDAIQMWAETAQKYGLRLVEVPIGEGSSITDVHPFRSPYPIPLALPPPERQPPTYFDATSLTPQVNLSKHYYQKAIMRKHDFVLDVEAAQSFPPNVEVVYSWGRPHYKYPQYIHRSGLLLAQILEDGNFIIVANKLYNNRALAASREQERFKKPEYLDKVNNRIGPGGAYAIGYATPAASPMLRPQYTQLASPIVRATSAASTADIFPPTLGASKVASAELIARELEDFCGDKARLADFYHELLERSTPPAATPPVLSLRAQAHHTKSHVLEHDIPALGLGPGLFPREGSPGPIRLTNVPLRRNTQHSDTASTISLSSHESPRGYLSLDGK